MSGQNQVNICSRCEASLIGQFCSHCGKPKQLKRIDGPFILSEIGSVLNFEKGVFFTIKQLLIRPGKSISNYIHNDRNRLVKPINFIILCSVILIILQKTLNFEDGYLNFTDFDWDNSVIDSIFFWISNNYGFTNIFMSFFIAFWLRLFFRQYKYNFFEILILLFFILGIQMLIFSFLGIIESVINYKVLNNLSSVVIIYFVWAVGRFFDRKKKVNYLLAFFTYFLGLISFLFFLLLFGKSIDIILNLF